MQSTFEQHLMQSFYKLKTPSKNYLQKVAWLNYPSFCRMHRNRCLCLGSIRDSSLCMGRRYLRQSWPSPAAASESDRKSYSVSWPNFCHHGNQSHRCSLDIGFYCQCYCDLKWKRNCLSANCLTKRLTEIVPYHHTSSTVPKSGHLQQQLISEVNTWLIIEVANNHYFAFKLMFTGLICFINSILC